MTWGVPRLLLLVVLTTLMVMQAGLALGQITFGATLTVLSGRVSVVRSNGSAVQPASTGLTLNVGDRVATVGRASALVTFFDGSEIELGGDTTISIGDASSEADDVVTFLIQVILGSTIHRVSPMKSASSSYRILAGDAVIEVRGTTAGASVDSDGNATGYLQNGTASMNGYALHPNEACTLDSGGAFECADQKSKDVWSVLDEGVTNGDPPKGNDSNTPKSDDDKDDKKDPAPTPDPEGRQNP